MPVVPPDTPLVPILAGSPFANQVLPNGNLPFVQQQNFGQMKGNVLSWNPDMDPEAVGQQLNGLIREIYDRRTWYGLMVRGQITTTGIYIGGTCNLTLGTNLVQGINTAWTPALIGLQFRNSYNVPPYTIIQVDPTNQVLALEMPWASPSLSGASYFIQQNYYTVGPNIKYIHTAKNLIMAWRMQLGYNQQSLDSIDPWRIATFSPSCLVQMPPDQNGNYQVELYPTPAIVQPIPFIAAVQPPNLVADTDTLPPYIRTDILVKLGIADALLWHGPKQNQYYDPVTSQQKRGEAEAELQSLALADENLYRQDLKWKWEEMRMAPMLGGGGAYYSVNHGVSSDSYGGGWGWAGEF
jgi:hypothetical protein